MGIRVHELAKELGITSKELVQELLKLKVTVKGHMSSLDNDTAELIRHELKPAAVSAAVASRPEPAPAAAANKMRLKAPITVKELAGKLNLSVLELITLLMKSKVMASINQSLDMQIVQQVGAQLGYEIEPELTAEEKLLSKHGDEHSQNLVHRPPVVTFMGHVDHGKTSLLDVIRKTNVVAKESGGITQHIGAYVVKTPRGQITFFDTPGHEAFTQMRARGVTATDIVILVVAADDGIMPQTIEAIHHAQAGNVPIVVAINKMDVPGANLDRVKRQLSEHNLMCEDWGGKVIAVPVSAKKETGIDQLLEMILLESELLELKADPDMPARGVVIESKLSPGRGPTAAVLIQNGTLRIGDVVVCGLTNGRIRGMQNDLGQRQTEAGPSIPVEISGLDNVPQVGDTFYVVEDERQAREVCAAKSDALRLERLVPAQRMSLEHLFEQAKEGKVKELNIILKADVQGSLEALAGSLQKLATKDIQVKVIHSQVGTINESDVMLATASDAVIIGFHVTIDGAAREAADLRAIDIRLYRIIYEAINDVRMSMEGLLEPRLKETLIGRAKVLQVFKISNFGKIAGCEVVKGKMLRSGVVRLFRNDERLYEGRFESLKRFKDDVKDVSEGMECGIALDKFSEYEPEDIIECYHIEKIARKL